MGSAVLWGAVAASSLVIGAMLGLGRTWPARQLGLVLAFGAGALISAVSFELWEEGIGAGGYGWVGTGLAVGALTYFFASRRLAPAGDDGGRPAHRPPSGAGEGSDGKALALGATLRHAPAAIRRLWIGVAAVCALATVCGYALADVTGDDLAAAIDGFAAGALLVMLIDSMIPEAREKGDSVAGLASVLGFAVAAGLSAVS